MIKIYCDKCGKEITDHVNEVADETEAIDLDGNVVAKWRNNTFHYCDECQYNDLTCDFKVGDTVITSTGQVGKITSICTCESCQERGFYEPTVEVKIGSGPIYITDYDKRVNFRSFYKIGDRIFGNIDEQCVRDDILQIMTEIETLRQNLTDLKSQLDIINHLRTVESI